MISDSENQQIESEKKEQDLSFIEDVSLEIRAVFGRAELSIGKLLKLKKGSIITFDDKDGVDSSVEIVVNGNPVGDGELVVVNENYGFRVTGVHEPKFTPLKED